jgi:CMP-N-acetylneuraminic acid synthetase
VPGKNVRGLNGHPLVAYSIRAAIDSGVFESVWVCSDTYEIYRVAKNYYAWSYEREKSESSETDFIWINNFFNEMVDYAEIFDTFAIIRPTTPFRKPETIKAMWEAYSARDDITSMRSMVKVTEHPMKMWEILEEVAKPLMAESDLMELYNQPTQDFDPVYVQNSSMEFCKTVNLEGGSWSGKVIAPFMMDAIEGFDINTELDWMMAEQLIKSGKATLPEVGNDS